MEQRLTSRNADQAELLQDLEDANIQLVAERKLVIEYQEQVTRILRLMERRSGGGNEEVEEKEDKGNHIARFSEADRSKL